MFWSGTCLGVLKVSCQVNQQFTAALKKDSQAWDRESPPEALQVGLGTRCCQFGLCLKENPKHVGDFPFGRP